MEQGTLEVPTLPFNRLIDSSPEARAEMAALLRAAALDRGFFRIGGVPSERITKILALGPKFFDMPLDFKMKYPWSIANNCGYSPLQTQTLGDNKLPDLNESMRLRAQLPSEQWPPIPEFEHEVREYLSWATDIADHVFAVLEVAFNLKEGILKQMHSEHVYTLRLIKYPTGLQKDQDRAGTHTDFTTITFVVSDRRGLEVEDMQGGWRWIDPESDALTCNFGDMMRFLIPDIKSTPHRVRGDVDAAQHDRYTAALFFHADPDKHLNLEGSDAGITSKEFLHNKHDKTQK